MMTTRGRHKVIDELTELSEFFSKVDAHLVSLYEKWMKKVGMPETTIDASLKKLISDNE